MLTKIENKQLDIIRYYLSLVIFVAWMVLDFIWYLSIDIFMFSDLSNYLKLLRPIKYAAILYCVILQISTNIYREKSECRI